MKKLVIAMLFCLACSVFWSERALCTDNLLAVVDSVELKEIGEFRKNCVFYENSNLLMNTLNYERITQLSNKNFMTYSFGAGMFWAYPVFTGRVSYVMGKGKHHFETGLIGHATDSFIGGVSAGYRFHGKKGWIIRIPVSVTNNLDDDPVWIWAGFSIGYSF